MINDIIKGLVERNVILNHGVFSVRNNKTYFKAFTVDNNFILTLIFDDETLTYEFEMR